MSPEETKGVFSSIVAPGFRISCKICSIISCASEDMHCTLPWQTNRPPKMVLANSRVRIPDVPVSVSLSLPTSPLFLRCSSQSILAVSE